MKKAGTVVPTSRDACVVFGMVNGSQTPKAGLFGQTDAVQAAKLARQGGLMTVNVAGVSIPKMAKVVGAGGIDSRGRLRLFEVSPDILAALHAHYRAQSGDEASAANGSSNPSEGSQKPSNGAPPPPAPAQPPSSSLDLGPSLMAAYRQLDTAGPWFEKAQTELSDVLGQVGASSAFSFLQEAEDTDPDHYDGGEGWVLDGWRWTFPARHRRQRVGQLSVVLDLGRQGRPAASLGMPCMLVMWSSATYDWSTAVDAAAGFWPPLRAMTELHGERLIKWSGKVPGNGPAGTLSMKDGAWFYLIRLAGLTNLATLRTHVVQPALALLGDKGIDTAFAKAPAVLRFRQLGKELVLDQ